MRVGLRTALGAATVVGAVSCSVILDFEDLEGLPCDCLPNFVCLSTSNTCVPVNSVDDYKSCDIAATPRASDQCQPGSECVALNEQGPRCLPRCTPRAPIVSEVGREIEEECGPGRYCWALTAGVGYCDDGECEARLDPCDPPLTCVRINNAGVCFAACDIYSSAAPCGATSTHCQPVAGTRTAACLPTGLRQAGEPCGLVEGGCDALDALGRGLICAQPIGSTNPLRTCSPVCDPANGNADCPVANEGCFIAIAQTSNQPTNVGICQGG